MFNLLTRRQLGMLATSLALAGGIAQAETFPAKPMTMVVPLLLVQRLIVLPDPSQSNLKNSWVSRWW